MNEENHYNILVIGNGFDLHHGLKTQYIDFIKYIKNTLELNESNRDNTSIELLSYAENNAFIQYFIKYSHEIPGWIDFENEIEKIIDIFKDFFYRIDELNTICIEKKYNNIGHMVNIERIGLSQEKCGKLMISILQRFHIINMNKVSGMISPEETLYEYCDGYYSELYGLNKQMILDNLKEELNVLIKALRLYLGSCIYTESEDKNIKKSNQIEQIHPKYVINFNYTSTCTEYDVPEANIFYIHGSLDKDNMVLGIRDKDESDLDFVYFKKYFQRIQKLTGYLNEKWISHTNDFGIIVQPTVHFYGHSLDNTDGEIIRELQRYARKMVIYYCNQKDYESKVINLISVFGKKRATEMIQTGFIEFELIENN